MVQFGDFLMHGGAGLGRRNRAVVGPHLQHDRARQLGDVLDRKRAGPVRRFARAFCRGPRPAKLLDEERAEIELLEIIAGGVGN